MELVPPSLLVATGTVSGVALLGLGVRARRWTGQTGGRWLSRLLFVYGAGSLVIVGALAVQEFPLRAPDWLQDVFGIFIFDSLFVLTLLSFVFASKYTGHGSWITTPRTLGVLSIPAGVTVIQLSKSAVKNVEALQSVVAAAGALNRIPIRAVEVSFGISYSILIFGFLFAGAGLLLRTTYEYEQSLFGLGIALCVGMLSVLPTYFLFSLTETHHLLGSVAASTVAAVSYAIATVWYDPFDSPPAPRSIGRDAVVSEMDDLVVVVDDERTLIDLNEAAEETFERSTGEVVGEPLSTLLNQEVETVPALDSIELHTMGGNRYYDVSVSELTNSDDDAVGYTLVCHDVTDQRTTRERLAVLNRIVRHNMRNDMSAIIGRAEMVSEGDVPPSSAATIAEVARDLSTLGEKARRVEEIMGTSPSLEPHANLYPVVEDVADRAREEFPDADIEVAVPEVTAGADGEMLRPVLYNLVENACDHAGTDPTVRITGSVDESRAHPISVTVADDGPGVPQHEQRVIDEETETQLEHGGGLGLWLVKWGVTRMSGQLHFDRDSDLGGAAVTVRLLEPGQQAEVAGAELEMSVASG